MPSPADVTAVPAALTTGQERTARLPGSRGSCPLAPPAVGLTWLGGATHASRVPTGAQRASDGPGRPWTRDTHPFPCGSAGVQAPPPHASCPPPARPACLHRAQASPVYISLRCQVGCLVLGGRGGDLTATLSLHTTAQGLGGSGEGTQVRQVWGVCCGALGCRSRWPGPASRPPRTTPSHPGCHRPECDLWYPPPSPVRGQRTCTPAEQVGPALWGEDSCLSYLGFCGGPGLQPHPGQTWRQLAETGKAG